MLQQTWNWIQHKLSKKNLNKSQRKKVANYCMHALIGIKYIWLKSSKPSSLVCETACWIYFSVTKRLIIKLCTSNNKFVVYLQTVEEDDINLLCLFVWVTPASQREVRISLLKLYTFFLSLPWILTFILFLLTRCTFLLHQPDDGST